MRKPLLLSAVLVLGASGLALADTPDDTDTTKTSKGTQTRTCDMGTVTFTGPQVLFPPNHKLVDMVGTATNTTPAAGAPVGGTPLATTITLTAGAIDDVVGGDGQEQEFDSTAMSGGVDDDGDGDASAPYQVRAERSGKGDGRTYTINWSASFNGVPCSSSDDGQTPFTVFVPHDQGKGND